MAVSEGEQGELMATGWSPINIVVIKYWGKRDEVLILPINESISITLDPNHLSATTTTACGSTSRDAKQKPGPEASVQDLASRVASRYMASTVKSVKTPKTTYDFVVSWRAISDEPGQQIQLLKSIPPVSLPEIFKNALSSTFLIDIVKCTTSFFRDDAMFVVNILENLTKVSRFDLIIMCLSSMHKTELRKIWDQTFLVETAPSDQVEALRCLRAKYIEGGWQDDMFTSS